MNESHEVVMAEAVEAPPRKSILEQLLHPESIQRMMQFGGVVLVLGCALWLWSIGIFDHPIVAALALGVTNLIVLASGCLLINKSRYELAGRGLTLLGSLALPLNLWFYDAQGLITLAEGGHLWIPAAAICFIYASVARVLKQPSFAYAFVGGVHLTGLLFLADDTVGLFWNWMPVATLFVLVGWACIFAKSLFPKEGDFAQDQFGVAFYRAGLASVVLGLGLVFWSQWCDFFQPIISFFAGDVVVPTVSERLWAAGLVVLSTFGFASEYLISGRRNRDAGLATGLLLWGILSLFSAFDIVVTLPIVAFALVAVVVARYYSVRPMATKKPPTRNAETIWPIGSY